MEMNRTMTCDQITVRGEKCSRTAVVEAYDRRYGWERYCGQHANYYGVRAHRQTREVTLTCKEALHGD